MAKRLEGKVAIVTGAGTGIGEAIAHKFAKEGAKVLLAGLPTDPVEDVARAMREHGAEVETYLGDLALEVHAQGCVDACVKRFGGIDVLVNNAGVFLATAETDQYPLEAFDATIQMNIRSVFLMTKLALPHLQESRGNIVAAGSEAGKLGLAMNTPYGGTKAWVHAFIQGVAVEQAKYGVRANCVCPGAVDTAWTHEEMGPMDQKMEDMIIAATPMARRGTAEEIANVYAFLASDEASFVTGALWSVDGGITTAKGGVGEDTPKKLRKAPEGELKLRHTFDGLANKETEEIR